MRRPSLRFAGGLSLLAVAGIAWLYIAPTNSSMVTSTYALSLAVAAQGLNFLYGRGGQLSIAQGAVWGIGAYTSAILFDRAGIGFWLSLPLAAVTGAAAAALVALPARRVSGHYFVITTFAAAEIFTIVADNLTSLTGGNGGLFVSSAPAAIGGLEFDTPPNYYIIALALYLIGLAAAYVLHTSRYGRRVFAAGRNETLARSLGVNVGRDRLIAFVIGGVYSGVAGPLYLYSTKYIEPSQFDSWAGISLVLVIMLGGAGSLLGPLVGGIVVAVLPTLGLFSPTANQIFYGLMLVAIIVVAPGGLTGLVRGLSRTLRRTPAPTPTSLVPRGDAS
jgi:branched-chain amino acid transport system permease protein